MPDEAGEFARHGNKDLVAMDASGHEGHEAPVQAVLRGPAHLDDLRGHVVLASREFLADLGRHGVVLRALDEQPARVRVAALGDGALAALVAAGGLRGNQAEIGHEFARVLEAGQRAEFAHRDHGGHDLEAFEGHESFDRRTQPPVDQEIAHGFFATFDPGRGIVDGHEAFLENGLHGRMRQDQFAQVTHVGRAPVAFALIMVAVVEQEGLEPLPGAAQIVDGIGARTAQVADGLVGGLGNVNALEVPGPVRPGQFGRVAPVGLDAVAGGPRDLRRSGHDALVAELPQTPRQDKAARTGLVTEAQLGFVLPAQPGGELFHRLQIPADHAQAPHFAAAPGFGHRDGDGVFVDIESDPDYFFHGVFVRSLSSVAESEHCSAQHGAVRADRPSRATRDPMSGKHTNSFQGCASCPLMPRSHKV